MTAWRISSKIKTSQVTTDEPLEDVNTFYGQSQVLFDVSLSVYSGEAVALLGRNGAGKTTTLRSIMGTTPPASGRIGFQGEEIQGWSPHQIRRQGIAWVPEDRRIFPNLTVETNIDIAATVAETHRTEKVYERFPQLAERRTQRAGTLSGGEKQMLAIARALVGPPTDLLLLDEPAEGLAPQIVADVEDIIRNLLEDDVTILLVEQNAELALELADWGYILETGRIEYQSDAVELQSDEETKRAYLGAQ